MPSARSPAPPAATTSPPTPPEPRRSGIAYPGGDLYPWLRQHGRSTEVVIPEREQRLAMAVLGIPGSGKTVTLLRRVWIAARAGMRVVFVDCKGTDPGLAWQVTCAYRLANPGAIVGFWPTQPLDCWRGDGMAIANRLLAVEDWASEGGGLYYRRMATLALQLACTPPSGPPRNSGDFLRRLDLKKLQQLWRGDPTAQADLEQLAADPHVLAGVRGRYSAFFRSLAGTADGCWGLEDVDLAVLTIPTIASRTDADAAVRLVLEDLGHFATRRKARVGDDVLLVLDEFSAVQGGTDQAIHLAERLRDVGVPVIFGAQSPEGLGDERQQWRLLHTIGGGLVLHQPADPDRLVQLAGTVRTPEQAWQLDPWGPAGQARVHMADRPRVDPNQVRQLHPGEAFLIQGGRAVKLSVLQAPGAGAGAGGGQRPARRRHQRGRAGLCRRRHRRRPTPSRTLAPQPPDPRPARPADAVPALEAPKEAAAGEEAEGAGPARPAPPAHPARPPPGRRPPRPGPRRRRHPGRPTRATRLGPHRGAGAPPRRRSLATLAAPARVPAVPRPGRPPGTGAPWLTVGSGTPAGTKQPARASRAGRSRSAAPPAPPGVRRPPR